MASASSDRHQGSDLPAVAPLVRAERRSYGRAAALPATALAILLVPGCGSSNTESYPSLPEAGIDAQFAGAYTGAGTYVASLGHPNSLAPDAGSPAPLESATGALSGTVRIDDSTNNAALTGDQIVVHLEPNGACDLPGAVTARRYDPSGGYVQLPLTIGAASLGVTSTCTIPVEGGTASFSLTVSDVKLYADGSLELSIAGPVTRWPAGSEIDGELVLSFFGRR